MLNFLLKLSIWPTTVYIADLLSPQINFYDVWKAILAGVVAGLVSYVVDIFLLDKKNNIYLTWLEVALSTLIVWGAGWFLEASFISFPGSLFTGILVGFVSYLARSYVLAARRREIV